MADWGLLGQFTAPEVADGVLDVVGQGLAINFEKKHEQIPLSIAKNCQPILGYTGFFLAHTGQKGAPPTPPIVFRAKEKKEKE